MEKFAAAWSHHPVPFIIVLAVLICALAGVFLAKLRAPEDYRKFRKRNRNIIELIQEKAGGRLLEGEISNRNISEAKALLRAHGDFKLEWTTVVGVDARGYGLAAGPDGAPKGEAFLIKAPR